MSDISHSDSDVSRSSSSIMSTSANLPAGFLITTLNGKRCTAVPRSLTTVTELSTTSTSVEDVTTAISSTTTETTASSTPAQTNPAVSSVTAAATVLPVITSSLATIGNEPQILTTSQITPLSSSINVIAIATSTTSAELITPSPTPQGSTPAESAPTSTSASSAQSDVGLALPDPSNNQNGFPSATETSNPLFPSPTSNAIVTGEASTLDSISRSQVSPAPIVGGVMGGLALVGLVGFLFWFFKRRHRYRQDSLLTPLDGENGNFSAADHEYISDEKFMSRFGSRVEYQTDKIRDISASITAGIAGLGASLKSKIVRHKSDTPIINLNRGNSQFLVGPIPQHGRNNSGLSDRSSDYTVKDRFYDWWKRFTESVSFSRILRRHRFASGGLSERQVRRSHTPDFSQLVRINERDLQLQTRNQQTIPSTDNSFSSSTSQLGSLGLSFESNNPFVDLIPSPVASTPQNRNNDNPFMDHIAEPQPPSQNKNAYVADVRRLRGQSTNATKTQATSRSSSASRRHSRYPSTTSLNRDSYRDTMFSSISANGRKGKRRSDPFDLERPELWMFFNANKPANSNSNQNDDRTSCRPNVRGISTVFPDPLRMSSVQGNMIGHTRQPSTAHTRTISHEFRSICSSGVSSVAGWAGPGPDLGPGSSNTSLRGNASSDVDSHWDLRRAMNNTSPVSIASESSRAVEKVI